MKCFKIKACVQALGPRLSVQEGSGDTQVKSAVLLEHGGAGMEHTGHWYVMRGRQ